MRTSPITHKRGYRQFAWTPGFDLRAQPLSQEQLRACTVAYDTSSDESDEPTYFRGPGKEWSPAGLSIYDRVDDKWVREVTFRGSGEDRKRIDDDE